MYCANCGNAVQDNDNFCNRCGTRVTASAAAQTKSAAVAPPATPDAPLPSTGVFINNSEISPQQALAIQSAYGFAPLPGRYWYDSMSGAWGLDGREAAGFLLPGHEFGVLSPEASRGNTGVFINGRQINLIEALRIQQTFGSVFPGRWWLDGRTGNFGTEGNSIPIGNFLAALQSQHSSRSGDNFWSSATACGNDDGHSGYINLGGGTIVGYDH